MRDETGQARDTTVPGTGGRLFNADPALPAGLYIVSTPIGNLRDITLRALDVLASADLICAEDTRVTGKLLATYSISTPLRPYHDHSKASDRADLIKQVTEGRRIALVSDAGTPLISDPGFKLVRDMRSAELPVFAIPGASAVFAALSAAGLPTDRFIFVGFPPQKPGPRKRWLEGLRPIDSTLVLFEGPSRISATLTDIAAALGGREVVVARELTKKFEEFRFGGARDLAADYLDAPPKGEVVILIGPPEKLATSAEDLDAKILAADDGRPLKEVSAELAEALGLRKRDVYARALELRGK